MNDHRPDDGDASRLSRPHADTVGRRDRLDELLVGLANRRRREVLYHLLEEDVSDLDAVTVRIADGESGSDDHGEIRVDLVHAQLPKLDDRGLIDYDPRSRALRLTEPEDRLLALLEGCRSLEFESE